MTYDVFDDRRSSLHRHALDAFYLPGHPGNVLRVFAIYVLIEKGLDLFAPFLPLCRRGNLLPILHG